MISPSKVVRSLAGGMKHFNDFVPVLLRAPAVPLQGLARDDGVAGEGGGCEGVDLSLAPEAVENKVSQKDEISLVGGRLGARGSEDQPTTHHRGRGGWNLERARSVKSKDLYQVSIIERNYTGQTGRQRL